MARDPAVCSGSPSLTVIVETAGFTHLCSILEHMQGVQTRSFLWRADGIICYIYMCVLIGKGHGLANDVTVNLSAAFIWG